MKRITLIATVALLPVLAHAQSAVLRDGRAVELSQSFYRGDTYDFVAELSAF